MRTTPGGRAAQFARHPIRRSARARVYTDVRERKWSLYGRSLAWWGWKRRDVVRVAGMALAGAIVLALVNAPELAIGSVTDLAAIVWADWPDL